jgi:hypothetical protein
MLVSCKYNSNASVPDLERVNGNLLTAKFDIMIGKHYIVFGQVLFARKLMYLVDPDEMTRPNWYPAELFDVVDGTIPNSWQFSYYAYGYSEDLGAIWGYDNLVSDPNHFNALSEREPEALLVFARQKMALLADERD